jgi:mitogen-activated protein kinase 1/3
MTAIFSRQASKVEDTASLTEKMDKVTLVPEILKSGFLEKKGNMIWSRRFFVLAKKAGAQTATLFYFKEPPKGTAALESESSLKGRVDMTWGAKVDVLPGRPHGFQVIMAKRALKVCAASEVERGEWLAALRVTAAAAVKLATVRFEGEDWSIPPKYKLTRKIGSGAYGTVAAAEDASQEARTLNDGEPVKVAIKKVADVFADVVDAKRILREVRLMRHWSHPCVLGLYDIVEPSFSQDFDDLYIVTPLLTTDLSRIVYSRTQLSDAQILYLFYQTCCGVHYVNSAGVLHRDLKPANLIIDVKSCALKVCDFGLSRPDAGYDAHDDEEFPEKGEAQSDERGAYTEYVVTRWYRAPEVMLGFHRYGAAIDAWSVACIFCEVCLKEPLFPGNDYLHQLKIILQQIGKPGEADQWFVQNANAKAFLDSLPNTKSRPLAERVPNAPRGLVDLAERMLAFDPRKRLPIAKSVEHAAFDDYREDDLELRAGYRVEMDDVENVTLDKAAIRALLWKDIRAFQRNSEPVGDRAVSPDDLEDGSVTSDLERLSNCYTMTTPPDTSIFRYEH